MLRPLKRDPAGVGTCSTSCRRLRPRMTGSANHPSVPMTVQGLLRQDWEKPNLVPGRAQARVPEPP